MANNMHELKNNAQRALVMQGGSSLGAYEAGAFKAIHERLIENDTDNSKSLFDVVAGTSIGAINAAILVNYAVKNGTWNGSWKTLYDFWDDISTLTFVEKDPTFAFRWNSFQNINSKIAKSEAARRYYSVKEILFSGAKNVFTAPQVIPDQRFFDPMNIWYLYDNSPLRKILETYLDKFPLKTKPPGPRLLLVAVDVQEGATVTFDSYSKETSYGEYDKVFDKYKYSVEYPTGLTIDHVLASASVPISYMYTQLKGKDYKDKKIQRQFWDGIILSNTPLRELISEHTTFWKDKPPKESEEVLLNNILNNNEDKQKVPDIEEVYIVNLWPTKEDHIPLDRDGQVDRKNDILYHDKTEYDQKVAVLVTDYIDLTTKIISIANNHVAANRREDFKEELERFLISDAKSKFRTGKQRQYIDLLKGRFHINKVYRIERQDDHDTISNKWADFSSQTINKLREDGHKQAKLQLK